MIPLKLTVPPALNLPIHFPPPSIHPFIPTNYNQFEQHFRLNLLADGQINHTRKHTHSQAHKQNRILMLSAFSIIFRLIELDYRYFLCLSAVTKM
jgi:hypothetical protein